ncbi:MAG: sigma-70 family RNA polymerase sigma factor [Acidobacteria bacterium]|nr:sigma-70 family RNA polymerase sigma factor [Acidobacteriota bacterium]
MFGFFRPKQDNFDDFEQEALPLMKDVYRVALWLTRNVGDAEDLTQETFVQAYKSFHRYEKGTNCRAWLMKIMYHTNGKRLRKLSRLKILEDPEEQIAATIPFEPPIPQELTDEDVLEALTRIPEQFRTVMLMTDVEEFSYKEVSQVLGIPMGTVMSRLHRGRKLLKGELAAYASDYGIKSRKLAAKN